MAQDALRRRFETTALDDTKDPPRFGQIVETAKDTLVLELRRFFQAAQADNRIAELPIIEKYQLGGGGLSPYESTAAIVRQYPGILEALPHVAVTAVDPSPMPLSIGPPLIAQVQAAPRVTATLPGPYALTDGAQLIVRSYPPQDKRHWSAPADGVTSTLQIFASRVTSIGAVTATELAQAINEQALYLEASAVAVGAGSGLELRTGGPFGKGTPNSLEVLSGSTAGLLTALGIARFGTGGVIGGTQPSLTFAPTGGPVLTSSDVGRNLVLLGAASAFLNDGTFPITAVDGGGVATVTNKYGKAEAFAGTWFVGARDDHYNPARPPKNRYARGKQLQITISILAQDDTVRTEMVDLVGSFFDFWLESKFFTFLGRSVSSAGDAPQGEHWMIVLGSDMRATSPAEMPRPDDAKDKLYTNAWTFSAAASEYLDRDVLKPGGPNAGKPWVLADGDLSSDDTLPEPT